MGDLDNPNENKSGDSPEDIELEPGEKAVIADRVGDDEATTDATDEGEHKRPPWNESGEHPNHPEVAGQPDPNG